MKKCSTCERPLKILRLRCEVCGSYNWYPPQIAILLVLGFFVFGTGIFLLDHLATADPSEIQSQQPSSQPGNNQPPVRQNVRGTRNGVRY